jgi:hypothetical protein
MLTISAIFKVQNASDIPVRRDKAGGVLLNIASQLET